LCVLGIAQLFLTAKNFGHNGPFGGFTWLLKAPFYTAVQVCDAKNGAMKINCRANNLYYKYWANKQ
jgi:hypothetical protein